MGVRNEFDTAQVSITTPFPGTGFYKKLVERGYLEEQEWSSFDGRMTCTFDTDDFKAEEIEAFRKKAIIHSVLRYCA